MTTRRMSGAQLATDGGRGLELSIGIPTDRRRGPRRGLARMSVSAR